MISPSCHPTAEESPDSLWPNDHPGWWDILRQSFSEISPEFRKDVCDQVEVFVAEIQLDYVDLQGIPSLVTVIGKYVTANRNDPCALVKVAVRLGKNLNGSSVGWAYLLESLNLINPRDFPKTESAIASLRLGNGSTKIYGDALRVLAEINTDKHLDLNHLINLSIQTLPTADKAAYRPDRGGNNQLVSYID